MPDIVELIRADHLRIDQLIKELDRALTEAAPAIRRASDANADIREAVREARLSPARSPTWHLAVQAACRATRIHIACEESGPLDRYRLQAPPAARDALGRQWVSFLVARILDSSAR